jgi:hypothetical protein
MALAYPVMRFCASFLILAFFLTYIKVPIRLYRLKGECPCSVTAKPCLSFRLPS